MRKTQQKPSNNAPFSGRILQTFENGKLINERVVCSNDHVSSFEAFIDLARLAGWHVSPPEATDKGAHHA